jgi:hypothetical protein
MHLRSTLVRLLVPAALLVTSALGAGWKWETFPH